MLVSRLQTPVAYGNASFGDTASGAVDCTGANLLLVFVVWNDTAGYTITSITYNGVSLGSPLATQTTNQRKQAVYALANPASGSNTLSVTFSAANPGANRFLVIGTPYSGVDIAGTPTGTINVVPQASGTSINSGTVSTSDGSGLFASCLVTREAGSVDNITASGSGHTATLGPTTPAGAGQQYAIGERAGSASNVTMGWGSPWTGSEENAQIVVPINAAAGGRVTKNRRSPDGTLGMNLGNPMGMNW